MSKAVHKFLFICCIPKYPFLTPAPHPKRFLALLEKFFLPHFHQKITIFPLCSNETGNNMQRNAWPLPTYPTNPKIQGRGTANKHCLKDNLRPQMCSVQKMNRDMTKQTKWVCAQRRLRSAWASVHSDQSLRCPHEESLGLSYPLSARRRLWSDLADVLADLSLRCAYTHFVGFVMSRLKLFLPLLTADRFIIWAGPWGNESYVICEQQRHRSACASAQSDQNLRCALSG